jgi:hypothetical protein
MLKKILAIAAVLTLAGCGTAVAVKLSTPITLLPGQSQTLKCSGGVEYLNEGVFPWVDHCNSKSTPTTTIPTTIPVSSVNYLTPVASLLPDSIFNQNVTNWPVSANSAAYVSNFVTGCDKNWGCIGVSTQPGYWVPANQADVGYSGGGEGSNAGAIPSELPIPYNIVHLNGSGDNPLNVWQTNGVLVEIWQAVNGGSGTWRGSWGGAGQVSTFTGVFPNGYGRSATSISEIATMVTEADVYHGAINHALSINLTWCDGFIAPATRGDPACGSGGAAPLGTWFRFAPGTTCNCTNPYSTLVFNAIKTYGMVSVDYSGAYQINSEDPSDWAAEGYSGQDPITASWNGLQEYSVLEDLPWASLQVVNPPGMSKTVHYSSARVVFTTPGRQVP